MEVQRWLKRAAERISDAADDGHFKETAIKIMEEEFLKNIPELSKEQEDIILSHSVERVINTTLARLEGDRSYDRQELIQEWETCKYLASFSWNHVQNLIFIKRAKEEQ